MSSPPRKPRMSSPVQLLLVMSLALLPIGALLTYGAQHEIAESHKARERAADASLETAASNVEALFSRNALALRIAAGGAFGAGASDPCEAARLSLANTPGVQLPFAIDTLDNQRVCGDGRIDTIRSDRAATPGEIRFRVNEDGDAILMRITVDGGTVTSMLPVADIRAAVASASENIKVFGLIDTEGRRLPVMANDEAPLDDRMPYRKSLDLANERIEAVAATDVSQLSNADRLLIFLPVAMFALAVLVAWAMVNGLLVRPLRRLQGAVQAHEPDKGDFHVPEKLGPASEIRDLGYAFSNSMQKIEQSETAMSDALEGQRRLVREVHHRVKNNLQVVASLLNIHSRGAEGAEAQAAYAGIGRRVEALAVVHRNHFAEVEESRGIQLRPLLTELSAGLRASASGETSSRIELDLITASTTQDTAVAVAFLVTEVVEFILTNGNGETIDIQLRPSSELTARLEISSEALIERNPVPKGFEQFERIVEGLARQLRSPLEKKVGRYAVELAIFPE